MDRPELECDGKCFLSDVLDNKQTDTPNNASIFLESELIFTTLCSETDTFTSSSIAEVEDSFLYTSHYKFQFLNRNFKPPILSV